MLHQKNYYPRRISNFTKKPKKSLFSTWKLAIIRLKKVKKLVKKQLGLAFEPVQRPKQKMLRKDCEECMKKAGLEKAPKILNAEKGQSRIGTMMEEKLNAIMKEQQCRISVRSVVGSKLKK
ncbi:hypothetical protein L5515_016701 [Caenorhabditis briggsae]|uniref:Uncharacterized protein n=1 Tax=Caenorhabditis briggsae TaxID=6238 RepID=A0AAE9JPU9_CAEBR|nr:hypothetical protein L5515_016701 [Caenorhabditis briggsae]